MLKASVNGLTTMDSTYSNVSAVKHQVYLKNRALMYTIGILLIGPILGFGYLFYLEGSAAFAIGFVMLIGIAMYGMLRLDFGKISHMIEVTPQFLRVDDCVLKEIAWQDIADLKLESHFSNGIKRSALLIIYLKTNHTYDLPVPGRILSRQRTDGGIVATNLYNYAGDYKDIFKRLCEARESGQFVLWNRSQH